jgi:hypothetical protein
MKTWRGTPLEIFRHRFKGSAYSLSKTPLRRSFVHSKWARAFRHPYLLVLQLSTLASKIEENSAMLAALSRVL